MKITKILVIVVIASLSLCGCNMGAKVDNDNIIKNFAIDDKTVTLDNMNNFDNTEVNKGTDNKEEKEYNVADGGELKLKNKFNRNIYKIDGNDVIYKGTRFYDMNKAIKKSKTKYNKESLLNFILDNVKTSEKEASVTIATDIDKMEGEGIVGIASLDEYKGYVRLRDKYKSPVTWELYIADGKNSWTIYGCDKYLFLPDTNKDIVYGEDN